MRGSLSFIERIPVLWWGFVNRRGGVGDLGAVVEEFVAFVGEVEGMELGGGQLFYVEDGAIVLIRAPLSRAGR